MPENSVFNRELQNTARPITADRAVINWGGVVLTASNISVQISRPVVRRRTIGNRIQLIHTGMPSGQITISRITSMEGVDIFSKPGWDDCQPATITITFTQGCGGSADLQAQLQGGTLTYTCYGCIVRDYQLQAEAEGLTVTDQVSLEFLDLAVD